MTKKLALLICTIQPAIHPEACVVPFIHAMAARALDTEVEIHIAGAAVQILVEGMADALYTTTSKEKTLGDYLKELQEQHVTLYGCSMAVANWVDKKERLLPFCKQAGATTFISRALDPEWQTLVY